MNVDCRNPKRWRDLQCMTAHDVTGTQWDWMQFFWNINTVGPNTIGINDIHEIWKRACGKYPSDCTDYDPLWWKHPTLPDLVDAIEAKYPDPSDPKRIKFFDAGDAFGVDDDP